MHLRRRSRLDLIGQSVDAIVALGAGLVRADPAATHEHLNSDALLALTIEEPADGVRRPAIASAICGPLAPSSRRSIARRGPALLRLPLSSVVGAERSISA